MAVRDYYRRIKKPVELPAEYASLTVGDYIRADLVRVLPSSTKRCFDNAVNFNRLGLHESEAGLSVLVSPLERKGRRAITRSEVKFWTDSDAHREASSLEMADSAEGADVVLWTDEERADPGWVKRIAHKATWRGWSGNTRPVSMRDIEPITVNPPRVGIVITVYNKPDRFVPCLHAVLSQTVYPILHSDVIVVNDGSDQYSLSKMGAFPFQVLTHSNMGYLRSANRGVNAAFQQGCELVVVLNSDVLVTRTWLSAMVRCHLRTGAKLVNPLCNQSGPISLPLAQEKSWGFPRLPGRTNYKQAAILASLIPPSYPDAVTNVGQCMLIAKDAWLKHGPFDGAIYGSGYGEECELWARIRNEGGKCSIADDAYVYHESHGTHEEAPQRERKGAETFINRWRSLYSKEAIKIKTWPDKCKPLRSVALTSKPDGCPVRFVAFNIGPYGGVACVLRLVDEMVRRGLNASVEHVITQKHSFRWLAGPNQHRDAVSLRRLSSEPESQDGIIIATHWFTGEIVRDMERRDGSFVPVAFWQDREDWFTEPNGKQSLRSSSIEIYPTIKNRIINADWVGASAVKDLGIDKYTHIPVGVDTNLFYPLPKSGIASQVRILGMYRPSTPRRGGKRLKSLFSALRKKYGSKVSLETFGAASTFGDVSHGPLSQDKVAELMRQVDIVVEPSSYQGFGLPGLEAIASGAALATTDNRGIHEYGISGTNCLIESEDISLLDNISRLVEDPHLRRALGEAGRSDSMAFDWGRIADRWFAELGRLYGDSEFNKYSGSF